MGRPPKERNGPRLITIPRTGQNVKPAGQISRRRGQGRSPSSAQRARASRREALTEAGQWESGGGEKGPTRNVYGTRLTIYGLSTGPKGPGGARPRRGGRGRQGREKRDPEPWPEASRSRSPQRGRRAGGAGENAAHTEAPTAKRQASAAGRARSQKRPAPTEKKRGPKAAQGAGRGAPGPEAAKRARRRPPAGPREARRTRRRRSKGDRTGSPQRSDGKAGAAGPASAHGAAQRRTRAERGRRGDGKGGPAPAQGAKRRTGAPTGGAGAARPTDRAEGQGPRGKCRAGGAQKGPPKRPSGPHTTLVPDRSEGTSGRGWWPSALSWAEAAGAPGASIRAGAHTRSEAQGAEAICGAKREAQRSAERW